MLFDCLELRAKSRQLSSAPCIRLVHIGPEASSLSNSSITLAIAMR